VVAKQMVLLISDPLAFSLCLGLSFYPKQLLSKSAGHLFYFYSSCIATPLMPRPLTHKPLPVWHSAKRGRAPDLLIPAFGRGLRKGGRALISPKKTRRKKKKLN
jgi:hypothetical protein